MDSRKIVVWCKKVEGGSGRVFREGVVAFYDGRVLSVSDSGAEKTSAKGKLEA